MITLSVDDQKEVTDLMIYMLGKIDPNGTHMAASNMKQAFSLLNDDVQILFLDIEMPGMNSIEAVPALKEKYKKLNIIFVTGHPEYVFDAVDMHPSGFLIKPVCEEDILRELQELRFPLKPVKSSLKVQCNPFALFVNDKPFDFGRGLTIELFAYLIYKEGAFCTNGELLGILWDGDPNKQGNLRQLVLNMRNCLDKIHAGNIIIKKYGKIGVDINAIECEGTPSEIIDQYHWN